MALCSLVAVVRNQVWALQRAFDHTLQLIPSWEICCSRLRYRHGDERSTCLCHCGGVYALAPAQPPASSPQAPAPPQAPTGFRPNT